MLLDGLHIPLTTPFYPDGRVYLRKLEANVARYSLTLVSGFLALSSAGEGVMLSDEERRQVLKTIADAAGTEKVLLASTGRPSVAATLDEIAIAADLLYDAVLIEPPSIYPRQMWQEGAPTVELMTYFQAVADRSALPVILCSHSHDGCLPVETIGELAGHPNVLGLLEQSQEVSRIADVLVQTLSYRRTLTVTPTFAAVTRRMLRPAPREADAAANFVSAEVLASGSALATAPPVPAVKTRSREVGFQVLWSFCEGALPALRAGAAGFVPALAAAVPQGCFELWAAWKDGDIALMAEKESRVVLAERAVVPLGVAGIKSASEQSGYFGGRPRLPLLPLTATSAEALHQAFGSMRS